MREPQECDNCLYTPPKEQPVSKSAPKSMYAQPEMEKTDGECPQCHYQPPADTEEKACPQCYYEPPKE